MPDLPRLYHLLRDRRNWRATLRGLVADAAGDLRLRSLPGGEGTDLPAPFDPIPSGLALAPRGELFLSDGEAGRVLVALPNGERAVLTDEVTGPVGLALFGARLWLAETAGRLSQFRLPDLGRNGGGPWGTSPAGIAADAEGRVIVADPGAPAVRRTGSPGFDGTVAADAAAAGGWIAPSFVAAGEAGFILVTDTGRGEVVVLDQAGTWLGPIGAPPGGWSPGALAAGGGVLYVADRLTGHILAMEAATSHWMGPLSGWRGPVAAMTLAPDGALWVKPGQGPHVLRLAPEVGAAAEGIIEAEAADAGLENGWARLEIDADLPPGAGIAAEAGLGGKPLALAWGPVPGLRSLLDLHGPAALDDRRFGALRIAITRGTSRHGPVLRHVALMTEGERLIDSLPRIYGREDGSLFDAPGTAPRAFLCRFLELLGADLAAANRSLDGLAQSLAVAFARPETLDMLADWLAFDLPLGADEPTRRRLIAEAIALHARRGTPASIRAMARVHSRADLRLTETFRERAIWLLDDASSLGFDTMLPPVDPAGLVLEGNLPGSGACVPRVGHAVVGETMPLPEAELFEPLFAEWAHRYTVAAAPGTDASALVAVLEAERPAHTDFTVCVARPGGAVGSARLGQDAILTRGPAPGPLGDTRLDRDLRLAPAAAADGSIASVGGARLGIDSGLG